MENDFTRLYVMLRPVRGACCGYGRLEAQGERGRISLHLSQLTPGMPMLRALIMGGDVETGAVADVGAMHVSPGGRAFLREERLSLPGGIRGYHTLAVCTDWPEGQLILAGSLNDRDPRPLWQLQEALTRYLTVPPCAPVKTPPAEPPQATLMTLPDGAPPANPLARTLLKLRWPEVWAELAPYFAALPPFAPFEAPGWRFVQVKLPEGSPGPWCAVGYHARDGAVRRVAYAIPCQSDAQKPAELADYIRTPGRHGQLYWVRILP